MRTLFLKILYKLLRQALVTQLAGIMSPGLLALGSSMGPGAQCRVDTRTASQPRRAPSATQPALQDDFLATGIPGLSLLHDSAQTMGKQDGQRDQGLSKYCGEAGSCFLQNKDPACKWQQPLR